MTARNWTQISFLGLALIVIAVYAGSLRGGFVYDDHWAIEHNNAIAHAPFWLFWTDPETGADPSSGLTQDTYRPLTVLSFAISRRLWGGHLTFWRLENVAWHCINGILFALLLRTLGFRSRFGLLFAMAVFLLHPLQVSTVAWIYQRGTLMSAAGCLGALLLIVDAQPLTALRWSASLLCFLAALFSKESAIVFPLIFWLVSGKMQRSGRWVCMGAYLLMSAGFLALRTMLLGLSQISDLPRGWMEKIVLTAIALPQYAGKWLLPWGLRASYDLPMLTPWRVIIAATGLLVLGWFFYRCRPSQRMYGLWAFLALVPMLPIAPIRAFFGERFFYFSSMGAAALFSLAIEQRRAWRAPALLWIAMLVMVTVRYADAWASDKTLWSWTAAREPSNAFAHVCLAETLSDPQAAQGQYFQALVSNPAPAMRLAAWNNLAVLALAQKQPTKALYWTAQVLGIRRDAPQALYNRWRALKDLGQRRQAAELRRTLLKDPRIPPQLLRQPGEK